MTDSAQSNDGGSVLDCSHEKSEQRVRWDSLKRALIALQCCSCGKKISEEISLKKFTARQIVEMTPWDYELAASYRVNAKKAREEKRLFQQEAERVLRVENQREDYIKYLESEQWQNIRRKVLARAKGKCEGCGEKPAEEVHHLTYRRFGNEMLFDLVAVCHDCHAKIHQEVISSETFDIRGQLGAKGLIVREIIAERAAHKKAEAE